MLLPIWMEFRLMFQNTLSKLVNLTSMTRYLSFRHGRNFYQWPRTDRKFWWNWSNPQRTHQTYTAYGMPPIVVPKHSVEKRVSFINDHLWAEHGKSYKNIGVGPTLDRGKKKPLTHPSGKNTLVVLPTGGGSHCVFNWLHFYKTVFMCEQP